MQNIDLINKSGSVEEHNEEKVVAAYRRQQEAKGAFSVINVSYDVMDVFSMTGINRKISITEA